MKRMISLLAAGLFIALLAAYANAEPIWIRWAPESGVALHQSNILGWNHVRAFRQSGDRAFETALAWEDTRGGSRTIGIQILEPDGSFRLPADGILVFEPEICRTEPFLAEGADGSWFLACNERLPGGTRRVSCTKIGPNGAPLWGGDERSVVLASGGYYGPPTIVSDDEGGCYVTVNDLITRNSTISIHHLLANGVSDPRWPDAGVVISRQGFRSLFPKIVTDEDGGAIILLSQERDAHTDIAVQRINPGGELLWNDGQPLPISDRIVPGYDFALVADGAGGAFAAWSELIDNFGNRDINVQRLDASATPLWTQGGEVIGSSDDEEQSPKLLLIDEGVVAVAWERAHLNEPIIELKAVMLTGDRNVEYLWRQNNGVTIYQGQATGGRYDIAPNADGGIFAIWSKYRLQNNMEYLDACAQSLSNAGDLLWNRNGVVISSSELSCKYPVAIPTEDGGFNAIWWAATYDKCVGLVAMPVSRDGELEIAQPDTVVTGAYGVTYDSQIVPIADGRVAVGWMENGFGGSRPMLKFLEDRGQTVASLNGEGMEVCPPNLHYPAYLYSIKPDGEGGVVAVWVLSDDDRNEIRVGRFDPDDGAEWPEGGVSVTDGEPRLVESVILGDGAGGAFVAWVDQTLPDFIQIPYIQRLNSNGERMWGRNGLQLDESLISCQNISLALDGEGGVAAIWRHLGDPDIGTSDQLYISRLDENGRTVWNGGSLLLAETQCGIYGSSLLKHPFGFAVNWAYAWADDSLGMRAVILVQLVTLEGALRWDQNGYTVLDNRASRAPTSFILDSNDHLWIAWEDDIFSQAWGDADVFLQALDPLDGESDAPVKLLPEEGYRVSQNTHFQHNACLASDGSGGVWLSWFAEGFESIESDIYATHLDGTGDPYPEWGPNGQVAAGAVWYQIEPEMAPLRRDGTTGVALIWSDYRSSDEKYVGNLPTLYCQRLDDDEANRVEGGTNTGPLTAGISSLNPNPFNSVARMTFNLNRKALVTVKVFDLAGREIFRQDPGSLSAGSHSITLNGTAWISGIYLVRLQVDNTAFTRRLVLVE